MLMYMVVWELRRPVGEMLEGFRRVVGVVKEL